MNFRATTCQQARVSRVTGWVRNLDDGRVEAVFEGPRVAVKSLVSWCYGGPGHARVEQVEVEWDRPTGLEQGYSRGPQALEPQQSESPNNYTTRRHAGTCRRVVFVV